MPTALVFARRSLLLYLQPVRAVTANGRIHSMVLWGVRRQSLPVRLLDAEAAFMCVESWFVVDAACTK